jgi:hypothetical protein
VLRGKGLLFCATALAALAVVPAAAASDQWLPHPADATWTWQWTDTLYAPTPTTEKVTVKEQKGASYTLAWTTDGLSNPDGAVSSNGQVTFQETNSGLVNTDWTSTPPPAQFPVLCASATQCPNALSSVFYNVIWGSRNPVFYEPLVNGLAWAGTGGAAGDVAGVSTYLGTEPITIPAFPMPVMAAKIQTQITQAGALGDPYGSGLRTTWWVYGVGPVKVEFLHAGGAPAAVTTAVLQSTNQTPLAPPTDVDYFPLTKGLSLTYKWTNTKHLKQPEVQNFTVDAVANGSGRFTAKDVPKLLAPASPIKMAGTYGFSKKLDGVVNLWGRTQSATLLKFPALGPGGAPAAKRNHFVTAFDLMTYGYNPIFPAYPAAGQTWSAVKPSLDFTTYGVTGQSKVLGVQSVTVPAGTFQALVVRSTLSQPGFPYGSGTRTSWFAPGKGLVKLVFAHGDHSVSTVVLLK